MNDRQSLTGEALAAALQALADGDCTVRLKAGSQGTNAKVARAFNRVAERNGRTGELLQRYESITKELQFQQQQLREANDRLEVQTENLKRSELLLKRQESKLRAANEDLESKAHLLSERMLQVELKNREVEQARAALEERAEQLTLSSRYKSDFLANMSHELRTPLNSLLILAKLLSDNPAGNLSPRQIEYARTILAAGTDLLSLINDILDLAKVESGTMTLNVASERFSELHEYVERTFRQVADGKDLGFEVAIADGLPESIQTDSKRLRQILRNLLSNAFKFTARGKVTLNIAPAACGWTRGHRLEDAGDVVAFSVTDTGIGIEEDKQKIIFDEFQQADGATSRQYGGTGLGLSISRELAHLLGGEIRVQSVLGQGSTFVLYLPLQHEWVRMHAPAGAERVAATSDTMALLEATAAKPADDRKSIQAGDRVVLIVERETAVAASQLSAARECGFKAVTAPDAHSAAAIARDIAPNVLILRDEAAGMPQMAAAAAIRVPVKLLDGARGGCWSVESAWSYSRFSAGPALIEALARLPRLTGRQPKSLLLAGGSDAERAEIAALLRQQEFDVAQCDSVRSLERCLGERRFDAISLAPSLEGMAAGALILRLARLQCVLDTPVIVCGSEPPAGRGAAQCCVELSMVKKFGSVSDALSNLSSRLDEEDRSLISRQEESAAGGQASAELAGSKALIIDDDIRNIFALTSALEHYGMKVIFAERARQGFELLKHNPDTAVALVDIMMPETDGYEAIRIIRGMEGFRDLPIIALTAKAMKGDREKCIEAGASDYMAKPVRIEQLISLLQSWTCTTAQPR